MRNEKDGAEYPDPAVRVMPAGEAGAASNPGDKPKRGAKLAKRSLFWAIVSWLVLGGTFCITRLTGDPILGFILAAPVFFAFVILSALSLILGACAIIGWIVALICKKPCQVIWPAWVGMAMILAIFLAPLYGWVEMQIKTGTRIPQLTYFDLEHTKDQHDSIVEKLEARYRSQGAYYPWLPLSSRKNQIAGFELLPPEIASLPTFELSDEANEHSSDFWIHPAQYADHFTRTFSKRRCLPYGYYTTSIHDATTSATGYIVWSCGPDGKYDLNAANIETAYRPGRKVPSAYLVERIYDPSNGAVSGGDIVRYKAVDGKRVSR